MLQFLLNLKSKCRNKLSYIFHLPAKLKEGKKSNEKKLEREKKLAGLVSVGPGLTACVLIAVSSSTSKSGRVFSLLMLYLFLTLNSYFITHLYLTDKQTSTRHLNVFYVNFI